jgi:hypothetical protein
MPAPVGQNRRNEGDGQAAWLEFRVRGNDALSGTAGTR